MTGLDHQAQVRRARTAVAGTSSLLIGVRSGHVVRELSGTLEHLSLVVRAVLVLDFLGHGLDFVDGVRDTYEIAPSDAVKRVACGADLTVDLVATADTVRRT